jgi:hypothetical protein
LYILFCFVFVLFCFVLFCSTLANYTWWIRGVIPSSQAHAAVDGVDVLSPYPP